MNGRPGRSPVALTVVATGAVTHVWGGRYAAEYCVFVGGGCRGGGGRRYRLPNRTRCEEVAAAVVTREVTHVLGGRYTADDCVFVGGGDRRGGVGRRYRLPNRTRREEVAAAVATGAVTVVRGGRRAAGPDGGRSGLPNLTRC